MNQLLDDHPTRLPVPWQIQTSSGIVTTQGARHACRLLAAIPDLEYLEGRVGSRSIRSTIRVVKWAETEEQAWLWLAWDLLRCQGIFERFSVSVGEEVEAEHRAWFAMMAKADEGRMKSLKAKEHR